MTALSRVTLASAGLSCLVYCNSPTAKTTEPISMHDGYDAVSRKEVPFGGLDMNNHRLTER